MSLHRSCIAPFLTHARSRAAPDSLASLETMASGARVPSVWMHAGGRADDPGYLLSCCFRVTLFRVKFRNKLVLTFALHHAVKTIQGRGCSGAQHARVISGADQLFQWEALSPPIRTRAD